LSTYRASGERGETLVEILVTVAIMGICFVAILLGVTTAYTATDTHRQESTAEGVLRSYAERIKDQNLTYIDCTSNPSPGPAYLAAAEAASGGLLPVSGFTPSVTNVTYWDGQQTGSGAQNPAFGACGVGDNGVQRISIQVVSPHGPHGATESMTIVKRRA
jgi:prepilin-type N-terminal cleavage/methylation domain-containing protein